MFFLTLVCVLLWSLPLTLTHTRSTHILMELLFRDVACYCSFFIECLWRAIDRFAVCFSFCSIFLLCFSFFVCFLYHLVFVCESIFLCVTMVLYRAFAGFMRILFCLHYTIFFIFYVALSFHSCAFFFASSFIRGARCLSFSRRHFFMVAKFIVIAHNTHPYTGSQLLTCYALLFIIIYESEYEL